MLPLYRDPGFTFRFADARIIPRIHLDDVESGRPVSIFGLDAHGQRGDLLASATVGDGGWVDLREPIVVKPGDAFLVVPDEVAR